MTEEQYVIVTNKTLLMSMSALLRDVIADESGCYGVTNDERSKIGGAIEKALAHVWETTPDLEQGPSRWRYAMSRDDASLALSGFKPGSADERSEEAHSSSSTGYAPSLKFSQRVESGMQRGGRSLLVVAHGGGVNSNAMLEGMRRRGIVPDLILAADTGGERPEIYDGWNTTSDWCEVNGMPRVVIVREPGPTLEEDCLTRKALPSIAYGFKTCSQRWKMRPQDRYLKTWLPEGATYRKAIGYDAGEERRCRPSDDPRCENWYPLIEWGMWREECVEHCREAGLPAVKSACFFCPSSKKGEVLRLAKEQPELMARAAAMEANADLVTVQGLGRHWSWANLVNADAAQLKLFSDAGTPQIDCGCYDGDSERAAGVDLKPLPAEKGHNDQASRQETRP